MLILVAAALSCKQRDPPSKPDLPAPTSRTQALLHSGKRSIADVAEQVIPSVVSVFSEKATYADVAPLAADPFYPHESGRAERREFNLGSGVVVSSDGVIITNSHVVAHAKTIKVALQDGRTLDAKVVGIDPKSDLAVLRVDAEELPAIAIAPAGASSLRVGDVVLAIGNPFGIGQTVTMGIVSAMGRANMGITDYDDFIQTDAAINPGNSGGALVNMEGQLVGINTAIISRTGGYQGIGFAIPSRMAIQIKDSLLAHGKVIRGWLGIAVEDLSEELETRTRVVISEVEPESPAAKAGLEQGDVVTAIDGVKSTDSGQVRNQVAMTAKGKVVQVEVQRGGKERTVVVSLGEQPEEAPAPSPELHTEGAGVFAGVTVAALDDPLRSHLELPDQLPGVIVVSLLPQSAAALMGLRPGDVILIINRTETPTVEAFHGVAKTSAKEAVLLVYRDGATIFMAISR